MKMPAQLSLWKDALSGDVLPREPLGGAETFDIAIVGAGYTGLWAAHYLARADPHLRICILEKEVTGFGASGRNGGWCSAHFPASLKKMAASSNRGDAVRQIRELFHTIDEVGRAVRVEGIDARFHKGGTLRVARNHAQVESLRRKLDDQRAWGFGEEDYLCLSSAEVRARVNVEGTLAGHYTPHCAALDPARLACGLAEVVERLGVKLYEHTPVVAFDDRRVRTPQGLVSADVIVLAIEAYAATFRRFHRSLVPLYSLMAATEPLSHEHLDQIGWEDRECLTDGRHLTIYLQRTSDGRIAIGGRGAPYHFASDISDEFDLHARVFRRLRATLHDLFPMLAGVRLTHFWGGPLGVPRDWYSSVGFDKASGYAWARGYVGNGVGISNLAGRTLRDLVLGNESDLVGLPWVGHHSPEWEPEPLRWLAVNSALRLMRLSDLEERLTGRHSRLAALTEALVGM